MDLYEQYDRIYRYCYYKLRHRELAEDVTQETFLRFYHTYGEKEQALHLLYTIAKNLCTDEFRKKREEPLETNENSGQPELQSAFEDGLLQNLAICTALEKLPEEDRELVLLRYVNEVPLSALSRLYGVSRFALYWRCGRILAALKQGLEDSKRKINP